MSQNPSEMSERITANHRVADDPLNVLLARALEKLGCRVILDPCGENWVMALGPGALITLEPLIPHCGPLVVEVRAQGLPNLLHEAVHIVLAERLDHDHGIDYQRIPFDLGTFEGRRVLWEELSCCVVSCAYLCHHRSTSSVDAWFAEQLEIQPVFYGFESTPALFLRRVRQCLDVHGEEFERTLQRAYRRMEALFRWVNAPSELARPPAHLTADDLWRNLSL